MRCVVLPYALPMIFAGFRIAAGTALLLLVAAEMIAAEKASARSSSTTATS